MDGYGPIKKRLNGSKAKLRINQPGDKVKARLMLQ